MFHYLVNQITSCTLINIESNLSLVAASLLFFYPISKNQKNNFPMKVNPYLELD